MQWREEARASYSTDSLSSSDGEKDSFRYTNCAGRCRISQSARWSGAG